jgi:RimJ/RimL family protein N-acetyltransferase
MNIVIRTGDDSDATALAELAARTVWLGVWERNARAKAFYLKAGFNDVGSQVFVVGTDSQTDRTLVRQITTPPIADGAS